MEEGGNKRERDEEEEEEEEDSCYDKSDLPLLVDDLFEALDSLDVSLVGPQRTERKQKVRTLWANLVEAAEDICGDDDDYFSTALEEYSVRAKPTDTFEEMEDPIFAHRYIIKQVCVHLKRTQTTKEQETRLLFCQGYAADRVEDAYTYVHQTEEQDRYTSVLEEMWGFDENFTRVKAEQFLYENIVPYLAEESDRKRVVEKFAALEFRRAPL